MDDSRETYGSLGQAFHPLFDGFVSQFTRASSSGPIHKAAEDLLSLLTYGPYEFDNRVCMCGSSFEDHTGWENHSYVDSGRYEIDRAMKALREALDGR